MAYEQSMIIPYDLQFHPEQPQTEYSIEVSRQFSLFFNNECDKINGNGNGIYLILKKRNL